MSIENITRQRTEWVMVGGVIAGLVAGLVATYLGFLGETPEFRLPGHDPGYLHVMLGLSSVKFKWAVYFCLITK